MLVLSRKENEQVIVGSGADAVAVTVVEIRGDKVRLGFAAPADVPIHRREVYDLIHKAASAGDAMADVAKITAKIVEHENASTRTDS